MWGIASTIPFTYIVYVEFTELGRAIERQPEQVRGILGGLRVLLVASWGFYPIAYIGPSLVADPALGEVIRQVGYSLADIVAKPVFGLVILAIATIKSRLDAEAEATAGSDLTSEPVARRAAA